MSASRVYSMTHTINHNELDDALRNCGSHWGAAQAHGLLCGKLAVNGAEGASSWRDQVLDAIDPADALRNECEHLLDDLFHETWRQLAERQSEFELILPDDSEDAVHRTQELSAWCEGFLHGLVSDTQSEAVRKRLAKEPLSDMIRDMLEMTRASVGDEDEETTESAYAELVEYIRVAVQLAFEELAEIRAAPLSPDAIGGSSDTIH